MNAVVSAVTARAQFGEILKRAAEDDERFVVDHRGEPAVIIMSIQDYIRNIAPTPRAFKAIRDEAKRKGTSLLTMRDIDREVAAVRRDRAKGKRRSLPRDPGRD